MESWIAEFSEKLRDRLRLHLLPPGPRRVAVGVLGGTLLLAGFAMVFLPGPALLVIPIALGLLATEFMWARRYLRKAHELFQTAKQVVTRK